METDPISTEEALRLHRQFLQDLLAEVMKALSVGQPGVGRLAYALEVYWEGAFKRRDVRRAVVAATVGTPQEKSVEPMGRPFEMMIRAELVPSERADLDQLAHLIYDEARAIALEEAVSGERQQARRERLALTIRG